MCLAPELGNDWRYHRTLKAATGQVARQAAAKINPRKSTKSTRRLEGRLMGEAWLVQSCQGGVRNFIGNALAAKFHGTQAPASGPKGVPVLDPGLGDLGVVGEIGSAQTGHHRIHDGVFELALMEVEPKLGF